MASITGQDLFCIQLFQSLYLYQTLATWDLYSDLCDFDSLCLLPMSCSSLTNPGLYLYHQTDRDHRSFTTDFQNGINICWPISPLILQLLVHIQALQKYAELTSFINLVNENFTLKSRNFACRDEAAFRPNQLHIIFALICLTFNNFSLV